jgi:hypothetical protein
MRRTDLYACIELTYMHAWNWLICMHGTDRMHASWRTCTWIHVITSIWNADTKQVYIHGFWIFSYKPQVHMCVYSYITVWVSYVRVLIHMQFNKVCVCIYSYVCKLKCIYVYTYTGIMRSLHVCGLIHTQFKVYVCIYIRTYASWSVHVCILIHM